jgi:AcrR family transcriptional regulator
MTTTAPFDQRLEQILATAAKVFADKGFHPTTMRDLSRATGMSLAGLYHYINGKDDLLFAIQQRCFTDVLAGAEASISGDQTPVERMENFIHHHVTFFARHMPEMKVLSHEANSLTGERLEAINQLKQRYVDLLRELIASVDGMSQNSSDAHVSAYALFGMMNWIYNWYNPAGPLPPEAIAERFTQIFLSGLTTPAHTTASHGG